MTQPHLILASASPRRRELLRLISNDFEVAPAHGDEHSNAESPEQRVIEIAQHKAEAVVGAARQGIVVGADTSIEFEGELLGKPHNRQQAEDMLRRLSGKKHTVLTGLCVARTDDGRTLTDCVKTEVWFKSLSQAQLGWYLNTGEYKDKAGAYAIQGRGALLVDRIEGDYYNVMGLPVARLAELLSDLGYAVFKHP